MANSSGAHKNGTLRTIVAGVFTTAIIALATQVMLNANRITAVETRIENLKENIILNRTENREEHTDSVKKLDALLRENR